MFKIGDKIRVRKPEDVTESPTWEPEMDFATKGIQTIFKVSGGDIILEDGDGEIWFFSPNWCTKAIITCEGLNKQALIEKYVS